MKNKKSGYVIAKDRVKLSAGDVIRISCEMMDLSQVELARRSGIAPSHISAIINGKRVIGKNIAARLAKVLNISPSVILFAGEKLREGTDIGSGVDASLLEKAVQAVEDNKNESTHIQLNAMRSAIEFIAKAILSAKSVNLAPTDLVAHFTKHSKTTGIKRRN